MASDLLSELAKMSRQLNSRRINRVAQMTMQEELIEKKKREILEKQKAIELTKLMTTTVPCPAAEFKWVHPLHLHYFEFRFS